MWKKCHCCLFGRVNDPDHVSQLVRRSFVSEVMLTPVSGVKVIDSSLRDVTTLGLLSFRVPIGVL